MATYRSNIWKLYLFKFLRGMVFVNAVLIPFFTDWGGISFTKAMLLQAWFVLWIFALEVPTGAIADRFGRKHSIILAGLFGIIAPIVYSSTPNFYIFLIGEFFWALAFALISGADQALLYDTLKKLRLEKESKKYIGRLFSFQIAGIMVSAPIGSIMAHFIGLRYTMLLVAIPFAMAFFVAFALKEVKIKHKHKNYFKTVYSGLKYFKNHQTLKIFALDAIPHATLAWFIVWLYQPMLMQAGLLIAYFGFVAFGMTLAEVLVLNNLKSLDKLAGSKKTFLFFSALLPGVTFVLGGLSSSLVLIIAAMIVAAMFGLTRPTLYSNYMHKFIPSNKRATVMSTFSMLFTLSKGIMYLIVGLMVDWSLNYTLIILGIVIVVLSLVSKVEEDMLID